MGRAIITQRDRDVFWAIYKLGPQTTRQIARAEFGSNENAAVRRLKVLRSFGYVVAEGGHRPPKDGSWRPAGRLPLRHEVTRKALEIVLPEHGEPVPKRWEPRW